MLRAATQNCYEKSKIYVLLAIIDDILRATELLTGNLRAAIAASILR
jgi:hypothetical protein